MRIATRAQWGNPAPKLQPTSTPQPQPLNLNPSTPQPSTDNRQPTTDNYVPSQLVIWGHHLGSDPVYCFRSNSSILSMSCFCDLDLESDFSSRRIRFLTLSGCDRPNTVASSRCVEGGKFGGNSGDTPFFRGEEIRVEIRGTQLFYGWVVAFWN